MSHTRRFGRLTARPPDAADSAFLEALYRDSRPDLGALPVPRSVIDGIALHQHRLLLDDYAARYPGADTWLVLDEDQPVARVVLDRAPGVTRVVDMAVAAHARRRGIARAVLQALQEEGGALALRVRADNAPARRLYAALGFTLRQDDGRALELGWAAIAQNE